LGVSIVWSLPKSEENIVEPEFPSVMESNLVSPQPELRVRSKSDKYGMPTYHTPKRDKDGDDIGDPKHPLRLDLEMSLNVPKHIT